MKRRSCRAMETFSSFSTSPRAKGLLWPVNSGIPKGSHHLLPWFLTNHIQHPCYRKHITNGVFIFLKCIFTIRWTAYTFNFWILAQNLNLQYWMKFIWWYACSGHRVGTASLKIQEPLNEGKVQLRCNRTWFSRCFQCVSHIIDFEVGILNISSSPGMGENGAMEHAGGIKYVNR